MRISITSDEDIDTIPGIAVAQLRPTLAQLFDDPIYLSGPLHCDGIELPDAHRTGSYPLIHGAALEAVDEHLAELPGTVARKALNQPQHLAALSGPRSGWLLPVSKDSERGIAGRTTRRWGLGRGRKNDLRAEKLVKRRTPEISEPLPSPRDPADPFASDPKRKQGRTAGSSIKDVLQSSMGRWLGVLLPMLIAGILAWVTGNVLFALTGLIGPLVGIFPLIEELLNRRRDPILNGNLPADVLTRSYLRLENPGRYVPSPEAHRTLRALQQSGGLAIIGPREVAGAAARHLIAKWIEQHEDPADSQPWCITPPAEVADMPTAMTWQWLRWWPRSYFRFSPTPDQVQQGAGANASRVAPVESASTGRDSHVDPLTRLSVIERWRGEAPPGPLGARQAAAVVDMREDASCLTLVLCDDPRDVPAWCRARWDVSQGTLKVGFHRYPAPATAADEQWLEEFSRIQAAVRVDLGAPGNTAPSSSDVSTTPVSLLQLHHAPGERQPLEEWLAQTYERHSAATSANILRQLAAPIGLRDDGTPQWWNLTAHGPHALVAGTTGAGKSELLQTIILSLALRYRSDELSIALVDYKGGASFADCDRLPHVVGQVTDLDRSMAMRALAGFRQELHRREELLASQRCTNLDELRKKIGTKCPPRLLIVVDEFRAMADDLPDFLPGLLTVAAQGRSLGVHLILATQRPGSAISQDIRANISLRACLRVSDAQESSDVLDDPAASAIPASSPGRALMRPGPAALDPPFQTALCGQPPQAHHDVQRALPWGLTPVEESALPAQENMLPQIVNSILTAHFRAEIPAPKPVWSASLPERVPPPAVTAFSGEHNLALGLIDLPDIPEHRAHQWQILGGNLAVIGPSGSGRTTALLNLLRAGQRLNEHTPVSIHLLEAESGGKTVLSEIFTDPTPHPSIGSAATSADPALIQQIAQHLQRLSHAEDGAADTMHLLLIDRLDLILEELDLDGAHSVVDALSRLLHQSGSARLRIAITAARLPHQLQQRFGTRVLLSCDRAEAADHGVDQSFATGITHPGRGILVHGPVPRHIQIFAPALEPPAHVKDPAPVSAPATGIRWRSLPRRFTPAHWAGDANGQDQAWATPMERGGGFALQGPDLSVAQVPPAGHILITGPDLSGRSTALRSVVAALLAVTPSLVVHQGWAAANAFENRRQDLREDTVDDTLAHTLADTLDQQEHLIVLDDAEDLPEPDIIERLSALPRVRICAVTHISSLLQSYQSPWSQMRTWPTKIVLQPQGGDGTEILGRQYQHLLSAPHDPPGRGVLMQARRISPIQVALRPGLELVPYPLELE